MKMASGPALRVNAGCELNRMEAGILVIGRLGCRERGLLAMAWSGRIAAARRERAALNGAGRIGRAPRDRRQWGMRSGIDLRNRREQRLGVGHVHVLEKRRGRRPFGAA